MFEFILFVIVVFYCVAVSYHLLNVVYQLFKIVKCHFDKND